jgi:hypothetical protein
MKVACLALVVALLAIGLAACQMSGGSGMPNSVVDKSVKLTDGNGNFVGYVTDSTPWAVTIYTAKGYFVGLKWDGVPADGMVYFTGTGGTGTKFYACSGGYELLGFVTFMSGQPYVATAVDGLGGAVSDPTITSYQSLYAGSITSYGSPTALSAATVAVPLKLAQYSDIALPSSIPAPLHLVFD